MHFLTKLTQIKPEEMKGAVVSFLFIFLLMASYMIVKPVRDALPSDWGDVSLAQQWTYTFIVSTIAVSLYNFCASKLTLRVLVPAVFVFFALSFTSIYLAAQMGVEKTLLGKVFYVWSSVFALFHISVFWSFISQNYRVDESKRVYGFINTGASVGAMVGPLLVIGFADKIDQTNILLITASVLLFCLPLVRILNRHFEEEGRSPDQRLNLNSNPFAGFKELITHRRLRFIACFIFLFTGISTFLYSAQKDLLVEYTRAERKELLGSVELATSILTILVGIFVTNRLSRKMGLSTALSIVPYLVVILLVLLSMHPAVIVVLAMQVVRRTGNYAVTRPAREMLFTSVDAEARFKTKPIIDVAIYRGGDVFWIWSLAFLGDGWLDLGLSNVLLVGAAIALIWGTVGLFLGRDYDRSSP